VYDTAVGNGGTINPVFCEVAVVWAVIPVSGGPLRNGSDDRPNCLISKDMLPVSQLAANTIYDQKREAKRRRGQKSYKFRGATPS
jgi:hypothetical protein